MSRTPCTFIAGDIVCVKGTPFAPERAGIVCAHGDDDFGFGMVGVRFTRPLHLPPVNYPAARLELLQISPQNLVGCMLSRIEPGE